MDPDLMHTHILAEAGGSTSRYGNQLEDTCIQYFKYLLLESNQVTILVLFLPIHHFFNNTAVVKIFLIKFHVGKLQIEKLKNVGH